ncbi:MAG TPA: glycosyltransferase 87 family protein [Candidatus Dormibacteraeota bacterium]
MIRSVASWDRRERLALAGLVAVLLGSLVFYMHTAFGHGDITLYHRYAQAFWLGSPRLHSLPAEYPLLSLVPFTLTLLPPLRDFVSVFALWMLVLFVAGYAAIRGRESGRAAEVCGVYLALGCFATVLGRFDLVPAAATVLAYWAARERRFTLAYGLLAVGTLLKLYPLFIVPIVVLEQYRTLKLHPLRTAPPRAVLLGLGLFFGSVAGGFAISAALNPGGWLGSFTYNAQRPLQVESVPASLLWLSGLVGLDVAPDHSFHSYNMVGTIARELSLLAELGLVGGSLWVYWRQLAGRLSFGRAITLCLLIVVCTNRVFSPQYLMWVVPMVAIMERDYDGVWLAICALTTLIFPYAYDFAGLHGSGTPSSYPWFFPALIALRNALLVVATARFARRSPLARAAAPDLARTTSPAA